MGDPETEQLIPMTEAASTLGIKVNILQYHIEAGNIESLNGCIKKSVCDEIQEQLETYISLRSFLKQYDGGKFESRYTRNREKYIDFLEHNGYFGVATKTPAEIFFNISDRDEFYISKEGAFILDSKSKKFFEEFGMSEEEKAHRLIRQSKDHPVTKKYVEKYLHFIKDNDNIYTPALTGFVGIIFDLPDIRKLMDEDIIFAIGEADVVRTKVLLTDFFKYVARFEDVRYHNVELKKKECEAEPAYSYEDYVRLAKILFNRGYDEEHGLTLKALEKSNYVETWMFFACHYVCGWRASDICNRWVYPEIKDNNNPFKINVDTLKEDILNGKIADETYDSVALYSIRRIEMSYNVPQKTGIGKLRSEIVPELRTFFGRLTLMAEYHHMNSGEGYMKSCRITGYRNWVVCRELFGGEIFTITGNKAVSSRRLNKSYLQGIEQSARDNGNTTLVAHVIASFARNHANIDTTATYLKDHGLTGENAEVVLYMMMQRGVFGVSLYHALIAAFPDAFEKLTAEEQTAIMERISLSAYELETMGSSITASARMAEALTQGKSDEPLKVLKTMFAVAQGKGKAKDAGIYCKRKALGMCCEKPLYESCLANVCPYHIFTSEGIPALVKVIKDYKEKAIMTGNSKYEVALKRQIIPAFQNVINAVIREMSDSEKTGIKKLIEEALNG